jgi:hypothetical protein
MYASEVNFPPGISKNFEIQKSVKWMSGNPLVSQSVRFRTPGVSNYMLTRSETLLSPFRVRGYAALAKNPLLSETVRKCPEVGTRNPQKSIFPWASRKTLKFKNRSSGCQGTRSCPKVSGFRHPWCPSTC